MTRDENKTGSRGEAEKTKGEEMVTDRRREVKRNRQKKQRKATARKAERDENKMLTEGLLGDSSEALKLTRVDSESISLT